MQPHEHVSKRTRATARIMRRVSLRQLLKIAQEAGLAVREIEHRPDGGFLVRTCALESSDADQNEWDRAMRDQ